MRMQFIFGSFLVASLLGSAAPVIAETPADFLKIFDAEARRTDPGFAGFSAARGRVFFQQTHGNDWSCASCHTKNPAGPGRHARTKKLIAPMASTVNSKRFTSARKVDKWFRRNCNDVLDRACTAREKGDVLTYLMSVR